MGLPSPKTFKTIVCFRCQLFPETIITERLRTFIQGMPTKVPLEKKKNTNENNKMLK